MSVSIPGMPEAVWKKVSSDQLLHTGDGRVLAIVAHHTATTTFELNDSTDNSGADFISVQVPANSTLFIDFSPLGGVPFVTAAYADFAAGTVYVALDV